MFGNGSQNRQVRLSFIDVLIRFFSIAVISTLTMIPLLCWMLVLAAMRNDSSRMNAVNSIGVVFLPFFWPALYLAIKWPKRGFASAINLSKISK